MLSLRSLFGIGLGLFQSHNLDLRTGLRREWFTVVALEYGYNLPIRVLQAHDYLSETILGFHRNDSPFTTSANPDE